MDPQTHTSNRVSKKVRESFKYNLVPGTNSINSVTDSLSESVNTVCSTMDLIRTAFRLSGHTVTSLSILSLFPLFCEWEESGEKSANPPAEVHHTWMENVISNHL